MKKIVSITLALFTVAIANAQLSAVLNPVSWNFSVKKVSDKTYEIRMKANIESGWHLFSQTQPDDAIAIPTGISFNSNPLITVVGKTKEIGKLEKFKDKKLGISANQYSESVEFVQTIKLKANINTNISGEVEYQTCDDKKCLPPKKIPFSLAVK
jgi:thiol:disulfide interchange protein DsbD